MESTTIYFCVPICQKKKKIHKSVSLTLQNSHQDVINVKKNIYIVNNDVNISGNASSQLVN